MKNPIASNVRPLAEYECSGCGETYITEVTGMYTSGGCTGHGEGEYCYCPYPEIRGAVHCPICDVYHDIRLGETDL